MLIGFYFYFFILIQFCQFSITANMQLRLVNFIKLEEKIIFLRLILLSFYLLFAKAKFL
jgi:hypothetical protein